MKTREMEDSLRTAYADPTGGGIYYSADGMHRDPDVIAWGGEFADEVLARGRTAVQQWTRRKRKEAYDAIMQRATVLWQANEDRSQRAAEAAWRTAVETWLLTKGLITITQNQKVLPSSLEKIADN